MMHPSDLAIDAYADDGIGGPERAEIERHLVACAECRKQVDDLRALRRQAASLEPMRPPERVWQQIANAIERGKPAPAAARASADPRWRSFAAVAALLLLVVSAWKLTRPTFHAPAAIATSAAREMLDPSEPARSVESELGQSEQPYHQAIAGLERAAEAGQGALDERTAATLRTNLSVIDHAIDESRAALDARPHSEAAEQSLLESFKAKIELLEDTIALINEVRKGNGTGAAQIASGINRRR
jgi:anti-sigma factor RsiW